MVAYMASMIQEVSLGNKVDNKKLETFSPISLSLQEKFPH